MRHRPGYAIQQSGGEVKLRHRRRSPRQGTPTVVLTHDLVQGGLLVVLLSGFFFARKVGMMLRVGARSEDEGRARKTLKAAGFEAPAALIPGDVEGIIAKAVSEQAMELMIMEA